MTKWALRNYLRGHLTTVFNGRRVIFRSKSVRIFNDELQQEKEEMRHWLKIYRGLIEIDGNVKAGEDI